MHIRLMRILETRCSSWYDLKLGKANQPFTFAIWVTPYGMRDLVIFVARDVFMYAPMHTLFCLRQSYLYYRLLELIM